MKKIEDIKDYNFKGLNLNFDTQTKELRKDIWFDIGTDKWIEWSPSPLQGTVLREAK